VCDYYTTTAAGFFAAPCLCRFLAVFRATTAALAMPTVPYAQADLPRAFDCVRCSASAAAAGACIARTCRPADSVWHPFTMVGAAFGAPSWPSVTAAAEPATQPENGWWTMTHVLTADQAAAGVPLVRGAGSCERLRSCWRDLGLGRGNYSVRPSRPHRPHRPRRPSRPSRAETSESR
jgi:hypothetical protein